MKGIKISMEEAERIYEHELDGWFIVNRFITTLWVLGAGCEHSSIPWAAWRKRENR